MPAPEIWAEWLDLMLRGLVGTLWLVVLSSIFTVLGGTLLAMLAVNEHRAVRWIARSWIEVLRAIPVLALMIFLYFGLGPQVAKLGVSAFALAVVALSASSSAYLAEIYRGAISGVTKTQWSAAFSIGMSHGMALRRVILPQLVPPLIPASLNVLISIIKLSSLASLITVNELSLAGTQAVSLSFYPMHVYVLLGLFYAAIILPLIYFCRWLEGWTKRRYGVTSATLDGSLITPYGDAAEEVAGVDSKKVRV